MDNELPSEMEFKSTDSGVLRRLSPSVRYYPYASGRCLGKEDIKEEVVRLGVELSLYVAESMFLLCDDIRRMLWFCLKLWRHVERDLKHGSPVVERLLRVIHYVYSRDIKPKNRVVQSGGSSVQSELIRTTYMDFASGIMILHRLVLVLRRDNSYVNARLLSLAMEKYKQVLKKLDDKLRSTKVYSEANGFSRETMESSISDLWKSLFDEEAGEATSKVTGNRILSDLFQPLLDQSRHSEIRTLPVYCPYILGTYFAKQELRDEVVQLGVELSLYVAESMFLLCDDIHSMLRFCLQLWRGAERDMKHGSPVVERMLRVIHYVYSKDIKPKNRVFQSCGSSVQRELIRRTYIAFSGPIIILHGLVSILRRKNSYFDDRELSLTIEIYREVLKMLENKLRSAKDVSEANGFARDVMESNISDLWKSLFDEEAKEATWTLKVIKKRILWDLFSPLLNEAGLPP